MPVRSLASVHRLPQLLLLLLFLQCALQMLVLAHMCKAVVAGQATVADLFASVAGCPNITDSDVTAIAQHVLNQQELAEARMQLLQQLMEAMRIGQPARPASKPRSSLKAPADKRLVSSQKAAGWSRSCCQANAGHAA